MAVEMDLERRRRLMELARLHREWQDRYDIDDAEYVPDGSDGPSRRPPTPEQDEEFMRQAREIMGIDPDTGLYRG